MKYGCCNGTFNEVIVETVIGVNLFWQSFVGYNIQTNIQLSICQSVLAGSDSKHYLISVLSISLWRRLFRCHCKKIVLRFQVACQLVFFSFSIILLNVQTWKQRFSFVIFFGIMVNSWSCKKYIILSWFWLCALISELLSTWLCLSM